MKKLVPLFVIFFTTTFLIIAQPQPQNNITRFVHYTSKQSKTLDGMFILKRTLIIKEECKQGNINSCKNQYSFQDENGDGSYDRVKVRLGKNYSTSRIVGKDLEKKINSEILAAVDVGKKQLMSTLDAYMAGKLRMTIVAKTVRFQSTEYSMFNQDGPDYIFASERRGNDKIGDTVKFIALGNVENNTSYNVEIWGLNKNMLQIIGEKNKISPQVAENMRPIGAAVFGKLRMDHGTNVGFFPNIDSFSKK